MILEPPEKGQDKEDLRVPGTERMGLGFLNMGWLEKALLKR